MHVENISYVVDEAIKQSGIDIENITAVAVTKGPGLVGALLVGVSFAKALAFSLDKPLVPVNHLEGHLAINYAEDNDLKPPFAALIISGGHTHLVEVKDYTDIEILGKTKDDAVGEVFDKVARVLGIGYPGGPIIDKMAYEGKDNIRIPYPKVEGYDFSFSGIKTHIINLKHNDKQGKLKNEDIAASFQKQIVDILYDKTVDFLKEKKYNTLVIGGGVSANSHIRNRFNELEKKGIKVHYPEIKHCTDNAAMIAVQGYYNYIAGIRGDLKLNATPNLKVGEI